MLAMEKHGMITRTDEKIWNARVNTWIRGPGCTWAAFVMYMSVRFGSVVPTYVEIIAATVVASLTFWNGQYYMQRVVGNTHKKVKGFTW